MIACSFSTISLALVAAIALLSPVEGNTPAVSSSPLDDRISHSYYFESHGRDDIREWRAAIIKGAQYIKIDFNFITDPDLCRQQTQFPTTYNFSMGCFLLVHSFRNTTVWGTPANTFNTTLDIAAWLLDDSNLDVMMLRPLVFQCCFKGKPNLCDGSDAAAQWIALMDAFYAIAEPIVSNTSRINGNVQFVFDQLNQADQCILERWRPWNSTWVGEAGTGEDNNNAGNATFQMVNMETSWTSSWQHLNDTNMGKFHNGLYAMVAWEPVDEVDCNNFFKYFRTFRYANPAGTILAFNADPSIFHVFTASETKRYSHFPFGPESALTPVMWYDDISEQLFTTSLVSGDATPVVVTIHQRLARGRFSIVGSVPIQVPGGDAAAVLGGALSSLYGVRTNATAVQLYVAGANTVVATLIIQFSSGTFTVDSTALPFRVLSDSDALPASTRLATYSGALLAVVAFVDPTSNTLLTQFFNVSSSGGPPLATSVFFTLAAGTAASDGLNAALLIDDSSNFIGLIVTWAEQREVFSNYLIAQMSADGTVVLAPYNTISMTPVKVGVGKNPFLSFAPVTPGDPTSTSLLLTYGWSFCYNDMLIDDDAFTMTSIKICDLQDYWYTNLFENVSNPVNSYVFTGFNLFTAEIDAYGNGNATQHRNGFATSCSDTIFHGVFDIGYNASVLLLPKRSDDVDIVDFGFVGVAAMTSLTWPQVSVSFCGNPVPHNGAAILDTFPLFGFYNQSAL